MTLIQLASFVRIAEMQSMSKAAAILNIAQPALSRQLRALERELDAALLVRHAWGVTLTEAGEVLLTRAKRILTDTDAARDAVRALAREPSGRIALGAPASMAITLLAPLAAVLRRKYPELRPFFVDDFSAQLRERVLSGELDLAILYADRTWSAASTTPLISEDLLLVGAPGAKVEQGDAAQMLKAHRLILPVRPNRLRLIVDEIRASDEAPPLEIDSLPAMIAMVQSGDGFAVLPYSTVANLIERGELAAWPLARPTLTRTLVLARAPNRHVSQAVVALQNEILAIVRDRARALRWRALAPDDPS